MHACLLEFQCYVLMMQILVNMDVCKYTNENDRDTKCDDSLPADHC